MRLGGAILKAWKSTGPIEVPNRPDLEDAASLAARAGSVFPRIQAAAWIPLAYFIPSHHKGEACLVAKKK